jgi:hypothetical protein
LRLSTIRHVASGTSSAPGRAQQETKIASGDEHEAGPGMHRDDEAEVLGVEADRGVDVIYDIANTDASHVPSSQSEICPAQDRSGEPRSYWRNVTLVRKRQVIALEVDAAFLKTLLVGEVGRGRQTRERDEVVDEMRLVEVSTLQCQLRPVRDAVPPQQAESAVKPLDTTEELRRHTNLGGETLDEASPAETSAVADVANRRAPTRTHELVERERDRSVVLKRSEHMCAQSVFHDSEAFERGSRCAQSLAQPLG